MGKDTKVLMLKDAEGCHLVDGKPSHKRLFKKGTKPNLCGSVLRTFLANKACEVIKKTPENKMAKHTPENKMIKGKANENKAEDTAKRGAGNDRRVKGISKS